jgi:hypothetical protein
VSQWNESGRRFRSGPQFPWEQLPVHQRRGEAVPQPGDEQLNSGYDDASARGQ